MAGSNDDGGALRDDSVVVARAGLSSCDLSGERVLLDLDKGLYHGLNGVASFLWERLSTPVRVEELHDAILAAYEVDPTASRADLLEHLGALRAKGLIEVRCGENT